MEKLDKRALSEVYAILLMLEKEKIIGKKRNRV